MKLSDAELIDIQKNKKHCGRNHTVIQTAEGRAVEFADMHGQRVYTLAADLTMTEWGTELTE
jgi:phenylacetate-coenzyme A ligase PaaK-like adenylate-forming protein